MTLFVAGQVNRLTLLPTLPLVGTRLGQAHVAAFFRPLLMAGPLARGGGEDARFAALHVGVVIRPQADAAAAFFGHPFWALSTGGYRKIFKINFCTFCSFTSLEEPLNVLFSIL